MIPLMRPLLDDDEAEAVRRVLESGWITQGPEVAAFERDFAAAVGAPHACAVSSGTAALHLALLAVGVSAGDEVVVPSHSFIASANAVRYCGAVPVLVDVREDSFNLDIDEVARAIGERTRAVLCVHQIGMPCDLARLVPLCRERGVALVEDAACAIGAEVRIDERGRFERIGKPHGDVACFSFHPRKVITTGDGGMVTTADAALDAKVRSWRAHAASVAASERHGARVVSAPTFAELGYNYRLTDIQAAIGRVQIGRLDAIIARRRALAARYHALLAAVDGVAPPHEPPWARSNFQSYCVTLPERCDQQAVLQRLLDAGIACSAGVMNIHREPAYAGGSQPFRCVEDGPAHCGCAGARDCRALRRGVAVQQRGIILPLYDALTDDEQQQVVDALAAAVSAS
ncbi:MAG: DegT/DnrJ/EryC1/StrS family aminotransferase [Myxococcales bacterium]|nr:DegT/DnrJ/EryC1/StrS family aminotransferase [Myxococcales bacterium]